MPKKIDAEKKEEGKDGGFNIEQLFGSKTRVRLLSLFLENPERMFYVRELTRKIDAQLNSVRRELKNLISLGIVLEVDGTILPNEKKKDKKKYYQADTTFVFFTELRSIMKKSAVLMNRAFVDRLSQKADVKLFFLTGCFVDETSPSDILVVGKIPDALLKETIENFEKQIGRELNYTYMPTEEFEYRREIKDRFLSSLMGKEKIILVDKTE